MLESRSGLTYIGWWVSVAGCLGYDVLGRNVDIIHDRKYVSVAGCLGYDVLARNKTKQPDAKQVSVAGCLGYDVLVHWLSS